MSRGKLFLKTFLAPAFVSVFLLANASLAGTDYRSGFSPLPYVADNPANSLNDKKVKLGKMLYFDVRLSKSGFINCNSCHDLTRSGTDNLPTSIGHGWQVGPRNAPTVYNAALNKAQFWDGRASDVEEQAGGPILNPGEMGASEELVIERLSSMPDYVKLFKGAFPGEAETLKYTNVARAIAAFERTLLTPSRFDEYLKGNDLALTPEETAGLKLFVDKGCAACHNGVNVGGGMFMKFEYGDDPGRKAVTEKAEDLSVFRVASLRNVAVTAPYFHDGKVWSLEEAVETMAEKQLGQKLTDAEVASIVAFLGSLTGKRPEIKLPMLPASTEATPRPEM